MAQKVQVILTDDIDGGQAEETVSFSLDGVSYEIDLSSKNAKKLRDSMAGFVEAGRRTGSARRAKGAGRSRQDDTAEIREWARTNGIEVSERGRISAAVRDQFKAAQTS